MTSFHSLISTAIIVATGAIVFAEALAQPNNFSTILGPDFSGLWRAEDAKGRKTSPSIRDTPLASGKAIPL